MRCLLFVVVVTVTCFGEPVAAKEIQKPAATIRPVPDAKNAMPISNPGSWVTTRDYPVEAYREDRGGVVTFRLTIAFDGSVESCFVVESSGSPDLDETACRLISQRARFRPSFDAKGKPSKGTYQSRVRWSAPYQPAAYQSLAVKQLQPTEKVLTYFVELDGTITQCTELQNGKPVPVSDTQSPCRFAGKTIPYQDENGLPVRKFITQRFSVSVSDSPKPDPTSPTR